MKFIRLINTPNMVAVVDDEDFEWLNARKWRTGSHRYAVTGKGQTSSMHRAIMNAPSGMFVDHIDGDGLNNRRSNLRLATHAQNCKNRRPNVKTITGLKGVYADRDRPRFRATIKSDGVLYRLGWFKTPKEASDAYQKASLRLHGEFGRTT